jgi:hypothetical protein
MHLLEANPDKIDWDFLSLNPSAISLLEKNIDKVNLLALCRNTNGMDLIKKLMTNDNNNFDYCHNYKIIWDLLMSNPSIFTYDYETMKKTKADLNEEVIAKALHPKRIFRLIEEYGEEEIYNIYFDED